jgi:hypothetical protein
MQEYTINDKTYVQKPLVLGQVRQLLRILDGVTFPEELSLSSLLDALGDRLYSALAVVITEKGCSPKDKDLEAMATDLEWAVEMETVLGIVADFFGLNPVSSILEKTGGMIGRLNQQMVALGPGSMKPSSSSPVETSQSETQSSGDIPSENAKDG